MNNKKIYMMLALLSILASCKSVKPYDMVYLNDSEMQMGNSSAKNYENYVQSIREGATPSGSIKSSGGCGCN
jgi:Domain of unknown function (DUF4266)